MQIQRNRGSNVFVNNNKQASLNKLFDLFNIKLAFVCNLTSTFFLNYEKDERIMQTKIFDIKEHNFINTFIKSDLNSIELDTY